MYAIKRFIALGRLHAKIKELNMCPIVHCLIGNLAYRGAIFIQKGCSIVHWIKEKLYAKNQGLDSRMRW